MHDSPKKTNIFAKYSVVAIYNSVVNSKQVESLKNLLLQAETEPVLTNSEVRRQLSQTLSEKLKPTLDPNPFRRWYRGLRFFVLDSWQRMWVIVLWLTVMVILFMYKYIQYKNRAVYEVLGHCVACALPKVQQRLWSWTWLWFCYLYAETPSHGLETRLGSVLLSLLMTTSTFIR